MALILHPIPAFTDNYIWALHDQNQCVLVDPGQAAPAIEYLKAKHLKLCSILITHHHADHIGGITEILEQKPLLADSMAVFGPADERIPFIYQQVKENDRVAIEPLGVEFTVLNVPGHTRSHIAYYNSVWLFAGDTLFSAGCGRLFEGSPQQMQNSLDKLAALPDHLQLCCTHEYTLDNLRFAAAVEPDNIELKKRHQDVQKLRADGRPTLPVTLAEERRYNPFLRTHLPSVQQAATAVRAHNNEPAEVLGVIRHWKDNF